MVYWCVFRCWDYFPYSNCHSGGMYRVVSAESTSEFNDPSRPEFRVKHVPPSPNAVHFSNDPRQYFLLCSVLYNRLWLYEFCQESFPSSTDSVYPLHTPVTYLGIFTPSMCITTSIYRLL